MTKRSRRKKAKRTKSPRHRGQRRQKLSKAAKELYPAASQPAASQPAASQPDGSTSDSPTTGDEPSSPTDAWEDELAATVDPSFPKARNRRRERAEKNLAAVDPETARLGLVLSPASAACRVEAEGRIFDCVLPSRLARDQQSQLAVGDEVLFARHGHDYRVQEVRPRRTTLSRPDPRNPNRERVIAANVDMVVQVVSTRRPPLRPALIDRCRIAIERGGAQGLLCVNKIDQVTDEDRRQGLLAGLQPYRDLGLEVIPCSAKTGEGIAEIVERLHDSTAVLVGHSGVGKSSLLNALEPELQVRTAAVASRDGRGRHTTTRSKLYRLACGARVIDTPGIREFGLFEFDERELGSYFPELAPFAQGCRFNDCRHLHEPDCAVRLAVDTGEVAHDRFDIYLRILESLTSR